MSGRELPVLSRWFEPVICFFVGYGSLIGCIVLPLMHQRWPASGRLEIRPIVQQTSGRLTDRRLGLLSPLGLNTDISQIGNRAEKGYARQSLGFTSAESLGAGFICRVHGGQHSGKSHLVQLRLNQAIGFRGPTIKSTDPTVSRTTRECSFVQSRAR
jgi:hypothetical protein